MPGIHRCAGCSHLAAEHFGQFVQQREVLLATHAITSGNDHRRSLDVDLALFHFAFDDAYDEIGVRSVFLVIHLFDDSFARGLGDLFFHHALAYGSHLRTAVRVDDRCDDVAAESRTNLVEQVFIDFAALVIGVRADFEARTVGRQAAVQCRRNTGTQIAAHRRSAEQCDLRLFFFENAADDCGVGQGPVRAEALGISDMDRVGTVLGQFFSMPSSLDPMASASSSQPSVSANTRPLVSSSSDTSATLPSSISQYTNMLFICFDF